VSVDSLDRGQSILFCLSYAYEDDRCVSDRENICHTDVPQGLAIQASTFGPL
jgi:hypothetical protein